MPLWATVLSSSTVDLIEFRAQGNVTGCDMGGWHILSWLTSWDCPGEEPGNERAIIQVCAPKRYPATPFRYKARPRGAVIENDIAQRSTPSWFPACTEYFPIVPAPSCLPTPRVISSSWTVKCFIGESSGEVRYYSIVPKSRPRQLSAGNSQLPVMPRFPK